MCKNVLAVELSENEKDQRTSEKEQRINTKHRRKFFTLAFALAQSEHSSKRGMTAQRSNRKTEVSLQQVITMRTSSVHT